MECLRCSVLGIFLFPLAAGCVKPAMEAFSIQPAMRTINERNDSLVTRKISFENGDTNSAIREFAISLARWRDSRMSDYQYEMRRICECGSASNALVRVVVRNGLIWDLTYGESSEQLFSRWTEDARRRAPEFAVGDSIDPEFLQAYPTIPELYGIIAETFARPTAAVLQVRYADDLGYPSTVILNPEQITVDDEMEYVVDNLRALSAEELRTYR